MLLSDRQATRRTDYLLATGVGLLFLLVGLGAPGFWEPWESGIVQVAGFVQSHAADPHVFWVPQTENHLVHKPLGLVWTLAAIHGLVDHPNEFVLRLPGALLGLLVLLTTFAVARRFFARRSAYATLLVLVSLPIFMFGSRLLAGGIWTIAAATLPLELFLLADGAETVRARRIYGALLGLSLFGALLAGGLVPLCVALLTIAAFVAWTRARRGRAAVRNLGFAVAAPLALLLSGFVFAQYLAHVPRAIEDRAPLDAATLAAELRADHVESIGERDGRLVGTFDETAREKHGAERFVLSLDGSLRGTELWRAWAAAPTATSTLFAALAEKGQLDDEGNLAPIELEPTSEGALKATLQFFTHDLYDPTRLNENPAARVRSLVAASPATAIVHERPENVGRFLARLTAPLRPAPAPDAATPAPPAEPQSPNVRRAPRTPATQPPLVLRNGQQVTLLGESEVPGWSEIEVNGRTGFVPSYVIEPVDPMPHVTFDTWVRHLGFGLFPWVILLPAALALLLLRRTQGQAEDSREADDVGAFLLIWLAVATLALGVGVSLFDNRFFTGAAPVALACGLLLASTRFWERVEAAPISRKFLGFGAICILAVLIHDYKEHPWLFIEAYLSEHEMEWAEKLQVVLAPFRAFRLVVAGLFVACFFGAVTFGNRLFERSAAFVRWRFAGLFDAGEGLPAAERSRGQRLVGLTRRVCSVPWRFGLRYLALGLWAAAQQLRRVRVALVLMAVGFAVLSTFVYLPAMSHHLTQKGLLESYDALSDPDEPLFNLQTQAQRSCKVFSDCESGSSCVRGQCKGEATSFYLDHVENIREPELVEQLKNEARVFAIIPRKQLARVNAEFRKSFPVGKRRNLSVLDTRSSRFLLVSNHLESGESDENYVADLILDGPPSPMFKPARPVRFSNGLEYLGHDLDPVEVASGDEFTVTYYFHVTRDITADWQMFLHVDFPGNRINGDHYPGNGDFHTNTWIAGDYVKDIQKLEVDRGSSAGMYELWFGFFSGGDSRLTVETGDHHDNRVRMGTMRVTGGL